MRNLLRILFAGLLLVVAVGTGLVALRQSPVPAPLALAPPVVVRKTIGTVPPKTVRRCSVAQPF